jgi:5'-3' exoribonuclease 1
LLDVKKGLGADMNFKLGQPFKPFQQLMGIMPDRSKVLLPSAYHDLMTSANSPIIDFYPRDFDLDMNGKKMEWEAVVKIPFIDEKRLLQAMASKEAQLSPDEQARNTFGVTTKFTYSADVDFIYPTSLTDIFPDLPHCHCVENVFDLPTMEGLEPYIGLVEGVKVGIDALAGFPSLKTLECAGALGFHGVNVFQQDSRNESMVVTLLDSDMRTKVEAAKAFLGKRVHVGYPFLQEALVTRVSDELFDYNLPPVAGGPILPVHHSPLQIDQWRKKVERIEGNYSKRYGIIIGPVESMMHVDMLKGLKMTDEGATIKEFAQISGQETDYASQLVVDEVISEDQRFLEQSAKPITDDFPIGTRAFFLGEFSYGKPLEVVSHEGTMAGVWISTVKGPEPDFGKKIARDSERLSPYTPSYAVARQLHFNALALSKITSSFSVMVDEGRVNLGLNLKFEAKKLKVLGYSRKGSTGWEFSQKAVDLLQQYMIKFPEFIAGLQQRPQGDLFVPTDFYPAEIAKDKIKEIQAWLKSIEAKNFERVPLEAEQLDSDVVKEIEKAADDNLRNEPAPVSRKIKAVPRKALLKPADAEHRLGNQAFGLGDRVVYVQDSGRVPIATRGTVVGMTRNSRTTLLDIVFDVTFMSGTSLGDRCSPFRGSTVPVTTVLNLSSRQLIAQTKAGLTQQPQTQPRPLTVRGYGPPGQGQLREATAPPPLRGSFRGAIAGQPAPNRGMGMARGRGRGSDMPHPVPQTMPVRNHPMPQTNDSRGRSSYTNGFVHRPRAGLGSQPVNRQGYTPLDRGNDDAGVVPNNPNFRPQSYSNVPPPASLDNRVRGRGRGSSRGEGRGRGINSGGRGRARGVPTPAQV